jgi:hypothetical protein
MDQRTSEAEPVSPRLAEQVGRMLGDFAKRYPGGTARLETFKGLPGLEKKLFSLIDSEVDEELWRRQYLVERKPITTVRVGTKSKAVLLFELNEARMQVSSLNMTPAVYDAVFAMSPASYDIRTLTVGELGFTNAAKYSTITKAARRYGLELCTVEMSLLMGLKEYDPPQKRRLVVATETCTRYEHARTWQQKWPIQYVGGGQFKAQEKSGKLVFMPSYVALNDTNGGKEYVFSPDHVFAFCTPAG